LFNLEKAMENDIPTRRWQLKKWVGPDFGETAAGRS